jgi:hypothetical protein
VLQASHTGKHNSNYRTGPAPNVALPLNRNGGDIALNRPRLKNVGPATGWDAGRNGTPVKSRNRDGERKWPKALPPGNRTIPFVGVPNLKPWIVPPACGAALPNRVNPRPSISPNRDTLNSPALVGLTGPRSLLPSGPATAELDSAMAIARQQPASIIPSFVMPLVSSPHLFILCIP